MIKSMDEQKNGLTDELTDTLMDDWMNERMTAWIDELRDEPMNDTHLRIMYFLLFYTFRYARSIPSDAFCFCSSCVVECILVSPVLISINKDDDAVRASRWTETPSS